VSDARAPVAVVVVTWNSSRWIDACLGSLRRLDRPPAEVVVVDGASTDGTTAFVRDRFHEVQVVECETNIGFCRANNIGISRTESPFVLALNPDTELEPGFLEEMLPALEDPQVGMVSGKLLRFDHRTLDSAGQELARSRQPLDRGYGCPDDGRFDTDAEVFGACGAAALYRRAMLNEVSAPDGEPFDERYFAFYEDLDLAWRARRAGWRAVYRHRALGYHARGGTSGGDGPPGRFRALWGRSSDVRFHVAKNRYLTILKNDTAWGYLSNLPFILARDAATLGLLLATSPGVLGRLWRHRAVFRETLRNRRLDAARRRHHVQSGEGP
jgi:GT2 family glycosyltransferase